MVLLTRHAPDLKTWIDYHLYYMEVTHIFIDVEDTPDFDRVWRSLSTADQDRITVWKSSVSLLDPRPLNNYEMLQQRQMSSMKRAQAASREMNINWLVHIDDDELLYSHQHRKIGEILASVPVEFDQVIFPNFEAAFRSLDTKDCFKEAREMIVERRSFVGYTNGKSALRITQKDAAPDFAHGWNQTWPISIWYLVGLSPLSLLHFESCSYDRWQEKFWWLGNTSPKEVDKIPFKYYRESISRMSKCNTRREAGETFEDPDDECSQVLLKKLWSYWKTADSPRLAREDLGPITIPWDSINASVK